MAIACCTKPETLGDVPASTSPRTASSCSSSSVMVTFLVAIPMAIPRQTIPRKCWGHPRLASLRELHHRAVVRIPVDARRVDGHGGRGAGDRLERRGRTAADRDAEDREGSHAVRPVNVRPIDGDAEGLALVARDRGPRAGLRLLDDRPVQ